MSGASGRLIEEMLGNPDLYPAQLLVQQNCIKVMHMSRSSYRASPFLDHRIVVESGRTEVLPFASIADSRGTLSPVLAAHYVFHNAFACSTLLTRYLDALQSPLVLREPNILYEVLTLKRFEGTSMLVPLRGIGWDDLYRFVTGMLVRRYSSASPTIIKPTDACNFMMGDLLGAHPGNRGLFIYSGPERFLASIMRAKERHEWARVRLRELLLDIYRGTGGIPVRPETLTACKSAALVWVLQAEQYVRYIHQGNETICVSLNADELVSNPQQAITALCAHFGIDADAEFIECCLGQFRTGVHSKASNERYDAEQRDADYNAARAAYSGEIDDALEWVRTYCSLVDPAGELPNSLYERYRPH